MKECDTTLNVAFLATPVSKGCIPTAYAHCFHMHIASKLLLAGKPLQILKVSVNNAWFLKYISVAQMSFSFACIKYANGWVCSAASFIMQSMSCYPTYMACLFPAGQCTCQLLPTVISLTLPRALLRMVYLQYLVFCIPSVFSQDQKASGGDRRKLRPQLLEQLRIWELHCERECRSVGEFSESLMVQNHSVWKKKQYSIKLNIIWHFPFSSAFTVQRILLQMLPGSFLYLGNSYLFIYEEERLLKGHCSKGKDSLSN